jgi:hypothetical protein
MMLKVYLVERRLKRLVEVPTDFDTDFTVRQFLYQLLALRLRISDYLHYGLFVQSEKKATASKRSKSSSAYNAEEEEDEIEMMRSSFEELVPVLSFSTTIEELFKEYGLALTLVVRKRIFPLSVLQKIESARLSEQEVELLFTQLNHENIYALAYNEELVSLKQAAILEVLKLMRKRFIGSSSIQGVLDNKILYERTDIRELHTIFPSHLITFFNKKGIWKRVQDAKLDLPFMSNVKQLQLLYIILSYQQQP